jgi:hypothetical protein
VGHEEGRREDGNVRDNPTPFSFLLLERNPVHCGGAHLGGAWDMRKGAGRMAMSVIIRLPSHSSCREIPSVVAVRANVGEAWDKGTGRSVGHEEGSREDGNVRDHPTPFSFLL